MLTVQSEAFSPSDTPSSQQHPDYVTELCLPPRAPLCPNLERLPSPLPSNLTASTTVQTSHAHLNKRKLPASPVWLAASAQHCTSETCSRGAVATAGHPAALR